MIRKVQRKPVVLDAVRFDGSLENRRFLEEWVRDPLSGRQMLVTDERAYVPTLEGTVIAVLGDWVVRGVEGEFYPVRQGSFGKLFELEG